MKKFIMIVVIILAMTTVLGSLSVAADKSGYIVVSLIEIPDGYNNINYTGESYCNGNDYVTGCSYLLQSYPGAGSISDYSFPVVQPIGCTTDKEGFRVCTGCRVLLNGTSNLQTEVSFKVFAYCDRGKH